MSKLIVLIALAVSFAGCSVNSQNTDKQRQMTNGPIPPDSLTATEQQNYGAGKSPPSLQNQHNPTNPQEPSPNHTNNLTSPAPATPTPQASGKENAPQKK